MDEQKQDAPVYDAKTGSVRPTDARYAGANRVQLTGPELAAIREQEIAEGTERLRKQQEKIQADNDQRLADSVASVSPPATATADEDQADTELKGQALEDALKERGLPTTGTADEKRARVAEHDAQA